MTEAEINRAVQYVTAVTSYGRPAVDDIVRTGLTELGALAGTTSASIPRANLLEYVCQWTIKRSGHPEPMVREVLGHTGRWLDQLYEEIAGEHPELLGEPGG